MEEEKSNRFRPLNLIPVMDGEPEYALSHMAPDFVSTIESFSQLSNIVSDSGVETYETGSFKKGGYTWKLLVYPSGDTINGGKGYISLYLVLQDSPSFSVDLRVFAKFNFFLFNHNQLEFVTFPDNADYIYGRKFDKFKNGYGYPQLIPLATFTDTVSSTYLKDDSCVFGVKVTVQQVLYSESKVKLERLCNSGNSPIRIFFKFSELENEFHETDTFTAGGQEWVLRLYPGWINGSGNHLSLFLRLSPPKSLVGRHSGRKSLVSHIKRYLKKGNTHQKAQAKITTHQKVHAKFTLRVVDQKHGMHVERTVCGVYSDSSPSWGCGDFMELWDLKDQSSGYIQNDNVIVEVDFSAIMTTNEDRA